MSFATDIHTLLISDITLNAAVHGIYSQNLPDNSGIEEINIVYTFSLFDSIDHLAKNNEIDIYSLEIIVLAPDTSSLDSVHLLIRSLLDNYESTKILDVKVQNSKIEIEGDRGQYVLTMNYNVTYYP